MGQKELKTFEREKSRLPPGRFALIKGDEVVGTYESQDEALEAGASQFGLKPFVVMRTGQETREVSVPALSLGVISADSTSSLSG